MFLVKKYHRLLHSLIERAVKVKGMRGAFPDVRLTSVTSEKEMKGWKSWSNHDNASKIKPNFLQIYMDTERVTKTAFDMLKLRSEIEIKVELSIFVINSLALKGVGSRRKLYKSALRFRI